VHGLGFLAVLAAGLSMRRIETRALREQSQEVQEKPLGESRVKAELPPEAPTHMVGDVLDFNQRFESIGEVAAVLILGALLSAGYYDLQGLLLAAALFLVIRPLSVWLATIGGRSYRRHKRLVAWFGIRGVGTLYYVAYATDNGLPRELADRLLPLVLTVVASSIVVHGISATPLMRSHERRSRRETNTAARRNARVGDDAQ
jgi:NhaP-type Na+/H+ or K+/H+ antiporter